MTKFSRFIKSSTLTVLVFVSFNLPKLVLANVLIINGSDQGSCPAANCGNNGAGGVVFETDNTLVVQNGQNIGQTSGVSVTVTGGNNIGAILFKGNNLILGSIAETGNILRLITLDSIGTVTANRDINVTTVDLLGPLSNLLMQDTADLMTTQINGSSINTVSLSLGGDNLVTGEIGSLAGPVNVNLVGGGGIVRTTGNIVGPVQFINSNQELIISNNKTITGTVTTTVNNTGTLTFQGNSMSSTDIGTIFNFLQTVNFNSGVFSLNNNIFATNTVVNACATLDVNNSVIIESLLNNGIVRLGTLSNPVTPTTLFVNTNYTGTLGSRLNMIVTNGGANYSRLVTGATGSVSIPQNGLQLIVTGNTIPNNTILFSLINAGTGGLSIPASIPSNTATYEFIPIISGNQLSVQVLSFPLQAFVFQDPSLAPIASLFDNLGPTIQSSAPNLITINDALNAMPNITALRKAIASLSLPVSGNLLAVSYGGTTRGFNVISERMDNNRAEFTRGETRYKYAPIRGIYCGNIPCDYYMRSGQWAEFYGAALHQKDDTLEGSGYRERQWTLIAGYDKTFYPSFNAGVAFAYSQMQANSKGWINNQLSADSYQGYLYASHEHCNGYYWDAIVSLTYNDYSQDRDIDILSDLNLYPTLCGIESVPFGFAETAYGRFGGWQFNGYFEGGYQFRCCRTVVIVPHLIAKTVYLRVNEFSETGAPIAGFKNIQYDDMQGLELGGGFKVAKNYLCCKKYKFTPYLKLVALRDFKNTPQRGVAQFIEGGPAFFTEGFERAANSLTTSLGLTLNRKDNSFVTLEYDFERRSDFTMYAAFLKYRVEWC